MYKLSDFGERLKEITLDSGKSVDDICEKLDMNTTDYYRWWSGTTIPKLSNIIALADYFKCSVEYLIGRADTNYTMTYNEAPDFGKQLKHVVYDVYKKTGYRVCKDLKINLGVFHRWIANERKPNLESLIKLANYFDCTLDFLLGRE